MKTTSRKIRRSFVAAAAVLFAAPFAAQAVDVNGSYNDDWNLSEDFFAPMYRAGNPDKDLLSNAYLRYDSNTSTVFVLVLEDAGALVPLSDNPDNAWVKVYSLGSQSLVSGNSGNDSMAPDFEWVMKDGRAIGWEGSFKLDPGSYGDGLEIHVNHGGETSSTGKKVTADGEELNTGALSPDTPEGPPVVTGSTDPAFIPDPKLDIEISTQGFDADEPTGAYIEVGDHVYTLYSVTNTGNVTLENIEVTGVEGLTPDCDGNGSNIIAELPIGESWNCSVLGAAVIDLQANPGQAESVYPGFPLVADEDPSHYFGAKPGLDLQVCTGSAALTSCSEGAADDHDGLPGAIVLEDEPLVYTYTATNTGNTPLNNVVVTDDSGFPVDCGDFDGTLAVDESVTCTAEETTVQGPHESAGQADAQYTVVNDQGLEEQRSLQDVDPIAYYALSQEQPSLVLTVTDFADNNEFNNGHFVVENASGDLDVTAVAITNAAITIEYRSSGKGKTSWVDAGISKTCTTDPAVPFVFEGEGEKSGTPGQQEVAFNCTADADTIPADYSAVRATVCVQIANRYVKVKGQATDQQKWFCSSSDR
ncbi:MAG: hypothetical protein WGN25_07705 [Candidatus Electrothrix sp. GW3-4]|uniref:DUF7507 domain-containing protein n=1 Tax=Candidatus Electrothrix sp. GW3-4 TaxID=3126740 RepID=UPI0030CD6869